MGGCRAPPALALLCWGWSAPACAEDLSVKVENYIFAASEALADGEPALALSLLRRAKPEAPESCIVDEYLCRTYTAIGNAKMARESYKRFAGCMEVTDEGVLSELDALVAGLEEAPQEPPTPAPVVAPAPEPALQPEVLPEPVPAPLPVAAPVVTERPAPVVKEKPAPAPTATPGTAQAGSTQPAALTVEGPRRALRNSPMGVIVRLDALECRPVVHWKVEGQPDWHVKPLQGVGPVWTWSVEVTGEHRPALLYYVTAEPCGAGEGSAAAPLRVVVL